ncbi:TetR/AcrR family transcriptional regulator [Desulfocurvibacter africanus]|uniref:Transcriptional regulator, TetR family n=1 Tax=Desulfocurvibacter africanus subsp. africanus str. Walvis Bay TaxID=690850 RepID=F3YYE2_DESAF|nr:TetR/AcrR family transcriptional regulator [Desulfocurvibacter africanus]EGJ49586.1 transcriptional regulator, TetR family [Desulfocurvibacter africanus subsp. africanus str. Walvis Bay]
MPKIDTKERILNAGAELVHSKGFNNTGIKEILDLAGVPKGSFYFYFPSKEAFGAELVEHYARSVGSSAMAVLKDGSMSPLERYRRFLLGFEEIFAEQGFSKGCPIGNLCQEMGDLSGTMRDKLAEVVGRMAGAVESVLREAMNAGEIFPDLDAAEMARFLLAGWQGSILLAKVDKSLEPMRRFRRMALDKLLKP